MHKLESIQENKIKCNFLILGNTNEPENSNQKISNENWKKITVEQK